MPNVGDIVNGSVMKILKAGALIQLGEGKTGFLHISQVSTNYVKDVNDYLKTGDKVTIRVMDINVAENRTYLSIKLVDEKAFTAFQTKEPHNTTTKPKKHQSFKRKSEKFDSPATFEDKMTRFLKDSQDKMRTIQKNRDRKQGVRKKPKLQ